MGLTTTGQHKNVLEMKELFCIMTAMGFTYIYTCTQIHRTVYPKKVSFTECSLKK